MNKETLAKIEAGDAIAIIWSIEDVYACAEERERGTLTQEEARKVLKDVEANHDCTYGVSWESIDYAIEDVILDRE